MKSSVCECGWKSLPGDEECAKCGANLKPIESGAKPKRRPRRVSIKKKARQNGERYAMLEFAASQLEPRCANCSISIPNLKYSNIDHVEPKSKRPDLRMELSNFQVLCDDVDMEYYKRKGIVPEGEGSCHHIKHHGTKKQWMQKAKKSSTYQNLT